MMNHGFGIMQLIKVEQCTLSIQQVTIAVITDPLPWECLNSLSNILIHLMMEDSYTLMENIAFWITLRYQISFIRYHRTMIKQLMELLVLLPLEVGS